MADIKSNWDILEFLVWFAIFAAMTDDFGAGGGIVGLLLFPLAWIIQVNLQERWCRAEARDDE